MNPAIISSPSYAIQMQKQRNSPKKEIKESSQCFLPFWLPRRKEEAWKQTNIMCMPNLDQYTNTMNCQISSKLLLS